jgi:hypothetical protein
MSAVREYLEALSNLKAPQAHYYKWQLENLHKVSITQSRKVIQDNLSSLDVRAKECYRTAVLVAFVVKGAKYCEGYVVSHIPIEHAWNSYQGHYFDLTSELFFGGDLSNDYSLVVEMNASDAFKYSNKSPIWSPGYSYWFHKMGKEILDRERENRK